MHEVVLMMMLFIKLKEVSSIWGPVNRDRQAEPIHCTPGYFCSLKTSNH